MQQLTTVYSAAVSGLAEIEWLGQLLARLAVGVLFALSGAEKLFDREARQKMLETIDGAGVPAPRIAAPFVSTVELVFGTLLAVGLATPLACLMLAAVMTVALATVSLPGVEASSVRGWLAEALYLPEVLYLVLLIWLLLSGPGRASLDALAS